MPHRRRAAAVPGSCRAMLQLRSEFYHSQRGGGANAGNLGYGSAARIAIFIIIYFLTSSYVSLKLVGEKLIVTSYDELASKYDTYELVVCISFSFFFFCLYYAYIHILLTHARFSISN